MMHAYLLLDSHQIEGLHAQLYALAPTATPHSLYLMTQYAAMAAFGPVVVGVERDSQLANTFYANWQEKAGIWLESDAAEADLIAHLRSLIHVQLDGDVSAFFRFYDPVITRLWLHDLPAVERDRLMGPVRVIRLPEADGSTLLISQQNPDQPTTRYAPTPWLKLSAHTLERLCQAQRRQFLQRLVDHVQRYFPHCLHDLHPRQQQAWALACQASAARQGYSAEDEVMLWASLFATYGQDFPQGEGQEIYRTLLAERGVTPRQRLDRVLDELTLRAIPREPAQ